MLLACAIMDDTCWTAAPRCGGSTMLPTARHAKPAPCTQPRVLGGLPQAQHRHAHLPGWRRPLREATGSDMWTMPLVHGFWQQRTLAVLGRMLTLSVIARRSRHFAGTRYRKRGIHLQGHVANDVETEQVAFMGFDWRSGYPIVSSAVQVW